MKKLTNSEFDELERNQDGDIIELHRVSHRMTDDQLAELSGDDASRADDFDKEFHIDVPAVRAALTAVA